MITELVHYLPVHAFVFKTKAELALDMLSMAEERGVPFAWVGMDCFYGQQPWLLEQLESEEATYIADIPNDTRVWRNCPKEERSNGKSFG